MDGFLRVSGAGMMAVALLWLLAGLNKPYGVRIGEESPSVIASANETMPGLAERQAEETSAFYEMRGLAITLAPSLFIAGAVLLAGGVVAGAVISRSAKANSATE
jgi:hypothetical protein